MQTRYMWQGVLLAAALAVGFGCTSTGPTTVTVESHSGTTIKQHSYWMEERLEIQGVRQADRNGYLLAQITAFNKTQHDFAFDYRFRWQDAQGMELPTSMSTWKPLVVRAQTAEMIQEVCSVTNATGYIVDIRAPVTSSDVR